MTAQYSQTWFSSASLLALTLVTVSFLPSAAWGQAASETEASDPNEIVVTANRREERLVDVPLAVSAISGDNLTAQGLTQIEDYASRIPGFALNSEGRLGTRLILRGQNTGGSGASVATMIDDVVLNSATANSLAYTVTANFETFDLERIEVLRGPQGTMYGATAQGGLLKYVTNKPKLNTTEAKAELGLDNNNSGYRGAAGQANIIQPRTYSLRLSAGF
jgi:iron complex outermembrane receptor protein